MQFQILIPLLTVFISIVASLIVTTMRNRVELKKVYTQLEQNYAKSLFDKRVELYPLLYEIIHPTCIKLLTNNFNELEIDNFSEKILKAELTIGIFFTQPTRRIFAKLMRFIREIKAKEKLIEEDYKLFLHLVVNFERSLRAEIGIYHTQPAGIVGSYNELKILAEERSVGIDYDER